MHAHRLQNINSPLSWGTQMTNLTEFIMYEPESEPERENEDAEMVEETCLQQDVSEW